jgi:hypothetical protein
MQQTVRWNLAFAGIALALSVVGVVWLEELGVIPRLENPWRQLLMLPVLVGVGCMKVSTLSRPD